MKELLNKRLNMGITLIALVITIIVIIILTATVVSTIVTNGIISRAQEARNIYLNAQEEEKDLIGNYDFNISSVRNAESSNPVGTVIAFMGASAPEEDGYIACDGRKYNVSEYPKLYNILKNIDHTGWTAADWENEFSVPDLRGEFLRGNGQNSHANQGSGEEKAGKHQDATQHFPVGTMANKLLGWPDISSINYLGTTNPDSNIGTVSYARGMSGTTSNWASPGTPQYTSRPTNTSVLYCIKAK